jgi:Calcineurin-like phosphoesterase
VAIAAGVLLGVAIVTLLASLVGPRAPASSEASPATTPASSEASPATTPAASLAPATGAPTTSPSRATTPTGSPPPTAIVLAAGDIASCSSAGDEATARLLDALPGTVTTLGDNVYPDGTSKQFRDCYGPTWGRVVDRTRPAPGNHDYQTAGAAGYFGYFAAAAGDPATGYYAYDLGAWRLYSLNSNCGDIGGCGKDSPEVGWLTADLAAHPAACVLAYWHHPRFSSGPHGSQAFTGALWNALYAAGAELVLNGHDHDYERFAPLSPDGRVDEARGIVEFVVGTGGFTHYQFARVLGTSQARNSTAFGVLELTLSPGAWASRFVPVAGQSYTDSAGGTCH